jgi:ATP-dependent 26S proteasome regulatory subunit
MAARMAMVAPLRPRAAASALEELAPALERLDRLLEWAAAAAQAAYGPEASADPYRGLYVSQDEVARLLARRPGAPLAQADRARPEETPPDPADPAGASGASPRLARLGRTFGLSGFDQDLILIALAPELDLRYERLYGYLQDDVTRRRPTVDLALNLLCPSAEAKLSRRAHLAPDAPLIRHGLLELVPDPSQVRPPILAHYLKLDDQVVRFLLGLAGPDPRLAAFCRPAAPTVASDRLQLGDDVERGLAELVGQAWQAGRSLRLYLHGPPGAGKRRAAEALAAHVRAPILALDLGRARSAEAGFEQLLGIALRAVRLEGAILFLEGVDALGGDERGRERTACLLEAIASHDGVIILAGSGPWEPANPDVGRGPGGWIPVPFPIPDFARRRACWQARLAADGVKLEAGDLDALAGRFRLTPGQIADAVTTAGELARWRAAARPRRPQSARSGDRPGPADLFAAARSQSAHGLATLARKVTPRYGWSDIVLPADRRRQLREIVNHVKYRALVYDAWGFDRKLSLGKGLNALFAGPSGTGKTMAAEIIAGELDLDLYKIDLSTVVSKYIGETEKNLARIFAEAETSNAILFFDEADALFGRRSEVRDSHDRYANIEISYLLQKMEEYDGIVILATNLRKNMDDAFVRRMHVTVEFPFPDEQDRLRIWETIWPAETPRDPDLDLELMARCFEIAGGNIRNVALAAAFLAAADGQVVTMAHLLRATRREYQKMGKIVLAGELGGYAGLAEEPDGMGMEVQGARA